MSETAQLSSAKPGALDDIDRAALYRCALICWQKRVLLLLPPEDVERILISFMAVGSPEEGERASALLASIRDSAAKQMKFDAILPPPPAK